MACGCEKQKEAAPASNGFTKAVVEVKNPSKITTLRKVVIPASLGDETTLPPAVGEYKNVILYYEASKSVYIYSSDGIPTLVTMDTSGIRRAIEELQEGLERETEVREDSDEQLARDISSVDIKLDNEIDARTLADTGLSDRITSNSDRITTVSDNLATETRNRQSADLGLQQQIDAISASSDVKDIVGTYEELENYDTSTLGDKDIIKVLQDDTQDGATTYYRWSVVTETFTLIGEEGPYYTKMQTDGLLAEKQDNLIAGTNIQIDGTTISATDTTYTAGTGLNLVDTTFSADTSVLQTKLTAGDNISINNDTISATDTTYSAGAGLDLTGTEFSIDDTVALKTDLPTVNNATLTIQKNGTDVATFTANSASNVSANITVPTDNAQLNNGAGYQTASDVQTAIAGKQNTLTAGNNIQISNDTISATDTTYSAGNGLHLTGTVFSADTSTLATKQDLASKQNQLLAGDNITFSRVLPSGYTQLDYIEANGTQSIDTGVTPTNTIGIYLELDDTSRSFPQSEAGYFVGAQAPSGGGYHGYFSSIRSGDLTAIWAWNGEGSIGTDVQTTHSKIYINYLNDRKWVYNNGTSDIFTKNNLATLNTTNVHYSLFAITMAGGSPSYRGAGKLYAAKFSDGQTIIRDFVPAKRNSDGKVGLYDTANGVFYSSATANDFTAGNEIDNVLISATDTTYSNFTGATSSTAGTAGLVPAPTAGDDGKFLSGDGSWTAIEPYVMPIASSSTLGGIKVGTNLSINPTTGVLAAVDSTYSAGTGLNLNGGTFSVDNTVVQDKLSAGSNIQINGATISATDTKYSAGTGLYMTGTVIYANTDYLATQTDLSGKQDTLTAGDNITISNNVISADSMVILSYGHSTWNDFITAYNANRIVYCRASTGSNPGTGSQTRLAFMAYVNNATSPTEVEFQYYRSVSTHSDSQQGDQVYVYKLTSSGTWTVTVREAYTKMVAGTNMTSSYSNGVLTLNASVPTNISAFTNDSGYQTASDVATAIAGKQDTLTAGDGISITSNVIAVNSINSTDWSGLWQ